MKIKDPFPDFLTTPQMSLKMTVRSQETGSKPVLYSCPMRSTLLFNDKLPSTATDQTDRTSVYSQYSGLHLSYGAMQYVRTGPSICSKVLFVRKWYLFGNVTCLAVNVFQHKELGSLILLCLNDQITKSRITLY